MHESFDTSGWVSTWAGPLFPNTPVPSFGDDGFCDQTIRMELPLSMGGSNFRLRLSNRFGRSPLAFATVTAGPAGGPFLPVTFGGRSAVSLAVGADELSDPVEVTVGALESIAVSLYAAEPTGPPTRSKWYAPPGVEVEHPDPAWYGRGLIADGDRTLLSSDVFEPVEFSGFVASVDVHAPACLGVVTAIGDSLTRAYPAFLARAAVEAGLPVAVTNVGIGGNRLLRRSACFGEAGVARLLDDVLGQTGLRAVIGMWTNDIGMQGFELPEGLSWLPADCFHSPPVTADDLITGWRLLVEHGRAGGVKVLGGTTPPIKGSAFYTPEKDEIRHTLNEWIRSSGELDGVVDFDVALRDSVAPDRIADHLHVGDFLHPNIAGARMMANAFDLEALRGWAESLP